MDDRALVTAMVRREANGLDGAYRRYADRLYAYCVSVLRDGDAAADVVQETFLLASERAGQLRDPDRLRPWLYAIARNECLRVIRTRKRTAPLDEAADVPAEAVDATASVQAAQLRELIGAATASLSEADREMIELSIRQGLSPAEVGSVLGLPANHAHARMSRARGQLLRALGALLVIRSSTVDCPTLASMKAGWDGQLTPLLRKRISRHIESCSTCTARQLDVLQPAALLPAYAGLAFAAAPAFMPRTGAGSSTAPHIGSSSSTLHLGPDGFPRPDPLRRRLATTAAAAVVLLLLVGGGAAVALSRGRPELPVTAAATPSTSAAAAVGSPGPGLVAPSSSPSTSPAPPVTNPPPTTTGPPPMVILFTATINAVPSCVTGGISIRFSVRGPTGQLSSAYAVYVYGPANAQVTKRVKMTSDANKADLFVAKVPAMAAHWWVELTAVDGRTYTSPDKVVSKVCI